MNFSDDFPMALELEAGMDARFVPPVMVAFGLYPMIDQAASKLAGHDVFVEVEHVKIAIPGDRTSLFFQPSTEKHRERFPQAYANFKNRAEVPSTGTPIEQWAGITRAVAMTLRAAHISTVEAFAAVHDGNIDRLGISNARELQARAKAFIAQQTDSAATAKLASEKAELEARLKALEAAVGNGTVVVPAQPAQIAAAPIVSQPVEDVTAARRPRQKAGATS